MEQDPTSIWKLFFTCTVSVYINEAPWCGVLVRWLMINSGTDQISHLRLLSSTNLLFWFFYFETYDVLLLTMVPPLFHQIPKSKSPILHCASPSIELNKQNLRLFVDGHWVFMENRIWNNCRPRDSGGQEIHFFVLFSFIPTSYTPITFVSQSCSVLHKNLVLSLYLVSLICEHVL